MGFIQGMEKADIDYRIIDMSANKARILMKYENRNKVVGILWGSQFRDTEYLWGKSKGYVYKYQLHELEAYVKDEAMVEIYYELPCLSLMPKILLPLDSSIQRAAWDGEDIMGNLKFLPEKVYMVFLIVQCVFFHNRFSSSEERFFLDRKEILRTEQLRQYLEKIFFSYTECVVDSMISGRFNDIYPNYIRFTSY